MPANDEFPRGWILQGSAGPGGFAGITVPAIVGIAHVLTDIQWGLINWGAGPAAGASIFVQVDGVNALMIDEARSVTGSSDKGSWTGKFMAPVNSSLSVVMNSATAAGYDEFIMIHGYDV